MENLTEKEIQQIREILEWWTATKSEAKPGRLRFDHSDSVVRSVRLGREFYELADTYARSGGYRSFSKLVETLLWRELGCDPKFLKDSSQPDEEDE